MFDKCYLDYRLASGHFFFFFFLSCLLQSRLRSYALESYTGPDVEAEKLHMGTVFSSLVQTFAGGGRQTKRLFTGAVPSGILATNTLRLSHRLG